MYRASFFFSLDKSPAFEFYMWIYSYKITETGILVNAGSLSLSLPNDKVGYPLRHT